MADHEVDTVLALQHNRSLLVVHAHPQRSILPADVELSPGSRIQQLVRVHLDPIRSLAVHTDHTGRVVPAAEDDLGQRTILGTDRHEADVTVAGSLELNGHGTAQLVQRDKVVGEAVGSLQLFSV